MLKERPPTTGNNQAKLFYSQFQRCLKKKKVKKLRARNVKSFPSTSFKVGEVIFEE